MKKTINGITYDTAPENRLGRFVVELVNRYETLYITTLGHLFLHIKCFDGREDIIPLKDDKARYWCAINSSEIEEGVFDEHYIETTSGFKRLFFDEVEDLKALYENYVAQSLRELRYKFMSKNCLEEKNIRFTEAKNINIKEAEKTVDYCEYMLHHEFGYKTTLLCIEREKHEIEYDFYRIGHSEERDIVVDFGISENGEKMIQTGYYIFLKELTIEEMIEWVKCYLAFLRARKKIVFFGEDVDSKPFVDYLRKDTAFAEGEYLLYEEKLGMDINSKYNPAKIHEDLKPFVFLNLD